MVADTQSHASQTECRAALEGIAHVTRKICAIWGTPELDAYLNSLLTDARDGARRGFPAPVAEDLLLLAQTNKMIRAMDLAEKKNLRIAVAYRLVDEGDQGRLRVDALDDPWVSRDTISRSNRAAETRERRSIPRNVGDRDLGLGALLVKVGKWALVVIVVLVCAKYVWRILKSLV